MTDENPHPACKSKSPASWLTYAKQFEKLYEYGRKLSGTGMTVGNDCMSLPMKAEQHHVVICSPHPDDEALTGALPYRLKTDAVHVLNLAITLGSNSDRQKDRKCELAASCGVLGFDCQLAQDPVAFSGLSDWKHIPPTDRQHKINVLAAHFEWEKPALVLLPHADDGHPTHRAVHYLTMAALRLYSRKNKQQILVAETEFWHPMKKPNLLLGIRPEEIAKLIMALTCHRGEIERNPYHLSLPARFMDNVRRGTEIMNYGGKSRGFVFAELYRLSRMNSGRREEIREKNIIVPPTRKLTLAELNSLAA